jgi:pyruvate dehydrogenase E2 component (dihydrolipoamide acetyltransferase)
MAKLSPTMEEGRVLKWLKSEGEPVESGEVLLEVETDKATMEIEAMGAGVLRTVLVEEGATVPTGTLLAVVAPEDEDISALVGGAGRAPAAESIATGSADDEKGSGNGGRRDIGERPGATPTSASIEPADQAPAAGAVATAAPPAPRDGGRARASPLARRMAEERGIELAAVRGSGPGGRIIKRDIEAASAAAAAYQAAPVPEPATPYDRVELSQLRKAIARNTAQSLGPIPHFYLTTEIDMVQVLELRRQLNASLQEDGLKIGVNDILVKTAARALTEHPDVNAGFAGDHIRRFSRVDIGIAVALPDGLITPVLRDAASKGLRQIVEERLAPEEYQGATFTISNLGMYGIDEFTAVINPPAATIMAVGATREKPVAVEGSVQVRARMRVTLSCDHRAVDGAMGAGFLSTFKGMLENPLRLVL